MKPIVKKWASKSARLGYHQLKNATRKYWYKGQGYYCVCCNTSYRKFLDMKEGSHPRENVICPGCGSVERHRMLLHYLRAHAATFFPKGTQILHIAPMQGIRSYLEALPGVQYLSADLDSSLADVHFNLEAIPYPDASFDFCICSHTLTHVQNDHKALSELRRVLSADATLLVLERIYDIPHTHDLHQGISPTERLLHYHQADRWRNYGQDFAAYLSTFGFSVKEVPYAAMLDKEIQEREVLNPDEVIFNCKPCSPKSAAIPQG